MNYDLESMTETEKAEAAMKQAARRVLERARQTGTPVILMENGVIVRRTVEELEGRLDAVPRKPETGAG